MKNYHNFYKEIFDILEDFTPLEKDCGLLCDKACCKGTETDGMILFPNEPTTLKTKNIGDKIFCSCEGSCDRNTRPLACRIFPFFPTINEYGRIEATLDTRAIRLCPMVENYESIKFEREFLRRIRKIGRMLIKDDECLLYIKETTAEIEQYNKLFAFSPKISKRK